MATAAEPFWRAGAVGHQRSRLAGRTRGRDLADQHDRRCDQPLVRSLCGQRLDGGKHEPVGEIREKAWAAVGLLHRQSGAISDCGENANGTRVGREKTATELPPTQIGRALQELGIAWIPAHSPQAKGRVERGFLTAQDRLVKGMRVAGVTTLEQANHYLETEFLPWVNATLAVAPANADDAHRPLEKQHNLAAILSHVESAK